MKILNKMTKFTALLLIVLMQFVFVPVSKAYAATDPGLGAALSFSVLAQTSITGISTISGDVGINSTGAGITALAAGNVGGTIYSTDGVAPSIASPFLLATVQADASTANGNMLGQGIEGTPIPGALDGVTRGPGVYDLGAGLLGGGVLTLDGPGIYIFRTSSSLTSGGSVNLINGARACDVFWSVNSLATINGSSFVGTIIAGTGIHFGDSVSLDGRALAIGGDVTMINDTITGPTCAVVSTPTPAPAPTSPSCSGDQHLDAAGTSCVSYQLGGPPQSSSQSGASSGGGTTSTGQVLGASTLASTGSGNSKLGVVLMLLGAGITLTSLYALKKNSL